MATSDKKAGSIAGSRKFEPPKLQRSGSFMPTIHWRYYAAISVAPLCRHRNGSILPQVHKPAAHASQTQNQSDSVVIMVAPPLSGLPLRQEDVHARPIKKWYYHPRQLFVARLLSQSQHTGLTAVFGRPGLD
jgi:hypothetical protein